MCDTDLLLQLVSNSDNNFCVGIDRTESRVGKKMGRKGGIMTRRNETNVKRRNRHQPRYKAYQTDGNAADNAKCIE